MSGFDLEALALPGRFAAHEAVVPRDVHAAALSGTVPP